MTQERVGALASAGAAFLFGSSYVATAFALRGLGPLPIGAWRGILAVAIVGLLVVGGRVEGRAALTRLSRGGWLRLAALGLLGGPIFIVAMNVAVGGAGATVAAFVAGLYAVLAALFGPLILREPLGRSSLVAFVVALVGTALLAGLDPSPDHLFGIAAGLLGAVAFALYLVLARRWSRSLVLPGAAIALANFLTSAVFLIAIALVAGLPLVPAAGDPDAGVAVLAVVWLSVGPSAAAQLLLVAGVRRLAARRSSAFLLLNPLTATALAAVLLGEQLAVGQAIGAVLVLVGIALATGLPSVLAEAYRRA